MSNTSNTAALDRLIAMATELGGIDGKIGNRRHNELTRAIAAEREALAAENTKLREGMAQFARLWEELIDFETDNPEPPKEAGIDECRAWRKELNAHQNVIFDLIERFDPNKKAGA